MSRIRSVVVVVLVVVLSSVSVPVVAGGDAGGDVLVVDADGEAAFERIQAAVGAASAGDTVRVRPGTYRESVRLREDVRVVAPRGATLNGSSLAGERGDAGVVIRNDSAPLVSGFRISGFTTGVSAWGTSGEWVLANTTIVGAPGGGVVAVGSSGAWVASNVTVRDSGTGVEVVMASGDWVLEDSVVRNVTEAHGVDAGSSTGDWTLSNVTVTDVDFVGVAASHSRGDWRVLASTINGSIVGVAAVEASGNWSVRGSVVRNASTSSQYDFWQPSLAEGVGVDASGTNGSWSVTASRFADVDVAAIAATDAVREGDATWNRFANGTPAAGEACVGHVDCSNALTAWPPTTTARRTRTTTETRSETTPGTRSGTTAGTASAATTAPGTRPGSRENGGSTAGFGVTCGALAVLATAIAGRRRADP